MFYIQIVSKKTLRFCCNHIVTFLPSPDNLFRPWCCHLPVCSCGIPTNVLNKVAYLRYLINSEVSLANAQQLGKVGDNLPT